jgi:hypothetical protein
LTGRTEWVAFPAGRQLARRIKKVAEDQEGERDDLEATPRGRTPVCMEMGEVVLEGFVDELNLRREFEFSTLPAKILLPPQIS